MPSWNIHTAHVERLAADRELADLGICDTNAYLFGNYVPDIYVGFMVADTTYRLSYCLTHVALPAVIPVPDADRFWDTYVCNRTFETPAVQSLMLGAWAHLVADRFYNGNFRTFYKTHDMPAGEELRKRKQGDFALFGCSLGITSHVEATSELVEAAKGFRCYSILEDDVVRSVESASAIVRRSAKLPAGRSYQLLSEEWMADVFEACNERTIKWLEAWRALEARGARCAAADVRTEAGLSPATPDGAALR